MVRILSNGDIVQDGADVPSTSRRTTQQGSSRGPSEQTSLQDNPEAPSPFASVNARLAEYGVPTYTVYGITIQPIHFVFALVSVLFFGLRSLLFIALILFVSNMSNSSGRRAAGNNESVRRSRNADSDERGSRQAGSNGISKSFSGTGHTLGK